MLKVYFAAQYSMKDVVMLAACKLVCEADNIQIQSGWLFEDHEPTTLMHELTEEELSRTAVEYFSDVMQSDAMVFYSCDPMTYTPRGGRHVEFGIALATNCLICVIGPKENIFHYLNIPGMIKHFETEQECFAFLKEYSERCEP